MATNMPTLAPFNPHNEPTALSVKWGKWLKRFEGAMVGFNITGDKRKRALLLHYGGEQLQTVFDSLSDTGDENDYEKAKEALTTHFVQKKNPIYETILFRRLTQNPDESVDQFCSRLRNSAEKCEFSDLSRELITQIITGCSSKQLRRRALEKLLTLPQLLELAQSLELSEKRARNIENYTEHELGWQLVFKAYAGTGISIYDMWTASSFDSVGNNYRNEGLFHNWRVGKLDVKQVKLSLYEHDEIQVKLVFDGKGSNVFDWFSRERLEVHHWSDLKMDTTKTNYFSIAGDELKYQSAPNRRFFINNLYGGCENDMGWLVVLESAGDCRWESFKSGSYPRILYSTILSKTVWDKAKEDGTLGMADYMTVHINDVE